MNANPEFKTAESDEYGAISKHFPREFDGEA